MSEEWGPIEPLRAEQFGDVETEPSTAEAALRGVVQGATADWSDEAAGAIDYVKGAIKYGTGRKSDYEKGRDESRKKNKAAEAAHPGAYTAGKVAGNIGLGAAMLPLSPVAAGAVLGGASAAGGSEDPSAIGTAIEGAKGAAAGALAGKIGQMAFGAAAAGMRKLGPAMGKASDLLTEQAITGGEQGPIANVMHRMATSDRGGSLTERAGRLGLMDSMSWAGKREAATVAQQSVAMERRAVMQALDSMPDVDAPSFKSLAAGVQTHPNVLPLLDHGVFGPELSDVGQEYLAQLASTEGWAGRQAALDEMESQLAKMKPGPETDMKVAVFRAAKGISQKEAEDAAERAGQANISAQLNSLGKDEALARLAGKAAENKISGADTKATMWGKLDKAVKAAKVVGYAATGRPVKALSTAASMIPGGSTLAARAAGGAGKLSGVMAKTARAVAAGSDDAAAAVLGERAGKEPDELNVAAAHMVAQQTGGTYQKKAGELAKRLSKEKPK
jgi:hypothetical protein